MNKNINIIYIIQCGSLVDLIHKTSNAEKHLMRCPTGQCLATFHNVNGNT